MSFSPLSIPSPPVEWQVPISIPVGEWLSFIPALSGTVIEIRAYALFIILGIIIATWLTETRLRRRGVEPWAIIDILIWTVPFGIIGARLWHVATHPNDFFPIDPADPWAFIRIWDGGGAIFGSLVFGALGAWIGCRITGIRLLTFLDALAPGLLLAQAIGRLGNWFNHELFGPPTELPWGLEIEASNPAYPVGLQEGLTFHPMFLYELLWNAAGAILILWLGRRFVLQWGKTFALYLIWYGIGRAILEIFRLDPSELILGIRSNDWGAIAAIVLGIIIFIAQTRRHPGLEPSPYRPGRAWIPPSPAADAEDRYSEVDDEATTVSKVG